MIDLGSPVDLAFTVRDSAGNLVDADATPVLTITLPDATSATPVVAHDGTGVYSARYVPGQAGRYGVRWVATGSNPAAYTDVFNVSSNAPRLIISLEDARTELGLPAGSTATDDKIRSHILAATPVMEDLVGPILPRTCDEWYDGGSPTVRLLQAPIISVTSVSESYGNFSRTLTEQPLSGSSFDTYGYTVDTTDGILQRRFSGTLGEFVMGRRNVHVVYVAGRTVVRDNILDATRALVKYYAQKSQTINRPDMGAADGVATTTTPSGFAVPRLVVDLCGDDLRLIGIA